MKKSPQLRKAPNPMDIDSILNALVLALPDPEINARNKKHFSLGSGDNRTIILKSAPWLSAETGEEISMPPEWTRFFPMTPELARADFVENLPDPDNVKIYLNEAFPNSAFHFESRGIIPDVSEGNTGGYVARNDPSDHRPEMDVRLVRNPLTGEEKFKKVPWIDPKDEAFILEAYRSNLEISRGKTLEVEGVHYEDPSDTANLRFFNAQFLTHFYRWGLQNEVFRYFEAKGDEEGMRKAGNPMWLDNNRQLCWRDRMVAVINLGGTIMSEETPEGVKPTLSYWRLYKNDLDEKFPRTTNLITMAPLSKVTKESEATNGLDSSQMEIDFLADIAIVMTSTWNALIPEDKKKFTGFVVPIGSDSCVLSMCYLKSILGPECPFSVIFVPAMKPIYDPDSEGMESLTSAYEILEELHRNGRVFQGIRAGGGLYDPTKTMKLDDNNPEAFRGKKFFDPTAGENLNEIQERFKKREDKTLNQRYLSAFVMRGTDQTQYVKADALSQDTFRLEHELAHSEAKAFLIGTFPSFTTAMNVMQSIRKGAGNRPVFFVNSILGAQGHGYDINKLLNDNGVHLLNMTPPMAQAKLNYALKLFPDNPERIINFMTKNNFIDEQPDGFEPGEQTVSGPKLRADLLVHLGLTPQLIEQFESLESLTAGVKNKVSDVVDGIGAEGNPEAGKYAFEAYEIVRSLADDALTEIAADKKAIGDFLPNLEGKDALCLDLTASIKKLAKNQTVHAVGLPVDFN